MDNISPIRSNLIFFLLIPTDLVGFELFRTITNRASMGESKSGASKLYQDWVTSLWLRSFGDKRTTGSRGCSGATKKVTFNYAKFASRSRLL
jgi:hypothetical protein